MSRDVALTDDGDIYPQTRYVEGIELVLQRIRIRLNTHLGEYLLDTREGMPYRRWLQTKPAPVNQVRDYVRREIEDTPGVRRVRNLEASLEGREIRIEADIDFDESDPTVSTEIQVLTTDGTARILTPQMR